MLIINTLTDMPSAGKIIEISAEEMLSEEEPSESDGARCGADLDIVQHHYPLRESALSIRSHFLMGTCRTHTYGITSTAQLEHVSSQTT